MSTKRDVISITRLKSDAAELVRSVTEDGRTLIVTQNGTARVAVIDVAELDRMRDALAMLKLIAQGEADIAAGRASSIDDVFDDVLSTLDE